MVATEEGVVWAFGKGEYGQLRLTDEDDRLVRRAWIFLLRGCRGGAVASLLSPLHPPSSSSTTLGMKQSQTRARERERESH